MGKVRRSTLLGLTLSLLFVAGCKVSCTTANISSLKFSKDKEGTAQTNSFAAGDTVYAIATVSNNPGKVTLKFRLFAEKVEGTPENTPVPNLDVSVEVPGDGGGIYTLRPTSGVWTPGRYRVEAVMLYNGEQKDQETGTFTVTGASGGGAPPPPTRPAAPPGPAGGETPEENANESEDDNSNSEP